MDIKVTQKEIKLAYNQCRRKLPASSNAWANTCPIARVVRRIFETNNVEVNDGVITVRESVDAPPVTYDINDQMNTFIESFDDWVETGGPIPADLARDFTFRARKC